jgi:hypothetical protein
MLALAIDTTRAIHLSPCLIDARARASRPWREAVPPAHFRIEIMGGTPNTVRLTLHPRWIALTRPRSARAKRVEVNALHLK